MVELQDRIKYMRKTLKIGSQEALAKILNVKGARVKSIETGRVKDLTAIEANIMVKKFNLNIDWLLTGEGEMLLEDKENLPVATTSFDEDDEAIPLNFYPDIVAAAGYGAINDNNYEKLIIKFDRIFLEDILNVRMFDKLDVIKVVGDSMEPFIHDGQSIIIERNSHALNGETVIANVNGNIYVKRYHADPFGKWVNLISENEIYGSIELDTPEKLNAFSIVGIVRAKIKAF